LGIAAGFVDTPLSQSCSETSSRNGATSSAPRSDRPRRRTRRRRRAGRNLMTNTAITSATYDIDGGQQLV
jgi:hypothetical protein